MEDPASALAAAIRQRHAQVLEKIRAAARRAGRPSEEVRLVVVTKTQPVSIVEAAIQAGVRILGENYAEEAVSKMQALEAESIGAAVSHGPVQAKASGREKVEWHMIGHIQSRKAQLVVEHFDLVHSLDSVKLAERLDRLAGERGRRVPVLLEFNVGGEIGKYGWPAFDESAWPQLLPDIEAIGRCANLQMRGLMTMPPLSSDAEDARRHFERLRKLQEFMRARFTKIEWGELSMGTSADYTVAVEEGATLVRVGEAILGQRPTGEHA